MGDEVTRVTMRTAATNDRYAGLYMVVLNVENWSAGWCKGSEV